jgi:hypothetical protein
LLTLTGVLHDPALTSLAITIGIAHLAPTVEEMVTAMKMFLMWSATHITIVQSALIAVLTGFAIKSTTIMMSASLTSSVHQGTIARPMASATWNRDD